MSTHFYRSLSTPLCCGEVTQGEQDVATWTGTERAAPASPSNVDELTTPGEVDAARLEIGADLTATRLRALEDGLDQPHLRPDPPPFWPTHSERSAVAGTALWDADQHAIMVIDGYGYTRSQWRDGEPPRYDIDQAGTWFDLETGRLLPPNEQPEALPARYGVWRGADGIAHVMVAEAGSAVEIPIDTTITDAVIGDLTTDLDIDPVGVERLVAAFALRTAGAVTELTLDDIAGLLRGEHETVTPFTWRNEGPITEMGTRATSYVGPAGLWSGADETPVPRHSQQDGVAVEEPIEDVADGLWDR